MGWLGDLLSSLWRAVKKILKKIWPIIAIIVFIYFAFGAALVSMGLSTGIWATIFAPFMAGGIFAGLSWWAAALIGYGLASIIDPGTADDIAGKLGDGLGNLAAGAGDVVVSGAGGIISGIGSGISTFVSENPVPAIGIVGALYWWFILRDQDDPDEGQTVDKEFVSKVEEI